MNQLDKINAIANSKVKHNIVDREQASRNYGIGSPEEPKESFLDNNWWWFYPALFIVVGGLLCIAVNYWPIS